MSKPDFRTLCADIVLASDAVSHDAAAAEGDFEAAIDNARTALDVQPEPVAPTDYDDKFRSWYSDRYGRSYVSLHGIALVECVEWTRFALARWGALAIQPVAVTNEELLEMASNALGYVHIRVDSKELEANGEELIAYARAVLARSLTPTIQPVPVSERPWEREGWLDAEGRCWMGHPGDAEFIPSWRLCRPEDAPSMTCSLPYWALPMPAPANNTRATH